MQVIKIIKINGVLTLALWIVFGCGNPKNNKNGFHEVGYFMKDGTGIYFLQIPNATGNIKQDLKENPEVNAIKLIAPYDSLDYLKYPADTLVNLRDSLQNISRNYSLAVFTPVDMEYTIDTVKYMAPELRHTISFPFNYSGGGTTITYNFRYIQVKYVAPLAKRK